MSRDNFWFQLAMFLILAIGGLFYIVRGSKRKDSRALVAGIILLTGSWIRFVLLLEPYTFNPLLKKILSISELVVPLSGIIIFAIYEKTWRIILPGIIFLTILIFGISLRHSSPSSSKISYKTAEKNHNDICRFGDQK